MPKLVINRAQLKEDLQEVLGGAFKLRLLIDSNGNCAAGVRWTDEEVTVFLNPKKIRTEKRLQEKVDWLRSHLAGF